MKYIVLTAVLLVAATARAADHNIVVQVNENDPKTMNLALNNVANLIRYYQDQGDEVVIEIVTYGPGLVMFHAEQSPVKERIVSFAQNYDTVGFRACANTMANMKKKSGKDVPLLPNVEVVPSGVVHVVARQEEGWSYVRP